MYYTLPIFNIFQGYFACRFHRLYIDSIQELPEVPKLTKIQIKALDLLEQVANYDELCFERSFEYGDIIFLNNHITLHARHAYQDNIKDKKIRHLLRLWLSVSNSRPLSPSFKYLFHRTEPGVIRGGFNF